MLLNNLLDVEFYLYPSNRGGNNAEASAKTIAKPGQSDDNARSKKQESQTFHEANEAFAAFQEGESQDGFAQNSREFCNPMTPNHVPSNSNKNTAQNLIDKNSL